MGAGGMARVYLAVHRDVPNLRVVLKILTDHQLADRFKQEADKLALVDGHPNICRIRHFFDHGDDLVIAMDYIDGLTVEQKIRKSGPLGYDEAIAIIGQVLDVLEFAHSRGISHRDIKPSNIMIDEHGRVKVIDFGIAKGETDPSMTAVNAYAGTPDYMAPEQFGSSEDTNYALADIYAVGVTFYEMLCGELPFEAKDLFAIRDAKMFQEPTNPRRFRPDMSKHLEHVILKAMSREPGTRFQTPREMKEFLLSGTARDLSRRTPPPTPAPTPARQPHKKRVLPKIVGTVVVLGALLGGTYFFGPALMERASDPVSHTDTRQRSETPASAAMEPLRLILPEDRAVLLTDSLPVFAWSGGGPGAVYTFECVTDGDFSRSQIHNRLLDTSMVLTERLVPGEYSWRVRVSGAGRPSESVSEHRNFTVVSPSETPAAEITVEPGELAITVDRPATISINGTVRARNESVFREEFVPGSYQVRVECSGTSERAKTETVTIESGGQVSRHFEFTEAAMGSVRVTSTPAGARLLINGEMQSGVRTPYTFSLGEGAYVVSAISEQAGNLTLQQSVEVEAGADAELTFDFSEAQARVEATQLADSVRAVMATLDDVARQSREFSAAQSAEITGRQMMGNERYDEAAKQFHTALRSLEDSRSTRDRATREVKVALEQFGQAYQTRDIVAIKEMYPSIPGNEESGWKQFFESARDLVVQMTVEHMTVGAAAAEVTVTVRMAFSDRQGKKDQSFRWLIQFEETGSAWIVASRQTL